MDNNLGDLDTKIKSKFQLFTGARPEEEDKKIFEEVYKLCFEEMLAFLGENLDNEGQDTFKKELAQQKSDEDRNIVLVSALSKIENYQSELNQRMDTLLNKLLEASLASITK